MGDTVRRPTGPHTPFVHRLLRHFETAGFAGAPRVLGIDDEGREVLSHVEGHVAWEGQQPLGVWSDESLIGVMRLVRRFHDVTAGTDLAGDAEVVRHGDLSPKNTVYRQTDGLYRPVAFIDWDAARPGRRVEDVAEVFWQFLCPCAAHPWVGLHGDRMRAMCDAYGLEDRSEVIWLMQRAMRDCAEGIETEAAAGGVAGLRLLELGAPRQIEAQAGWVAAHREELEAGLRR